MSRRLLKIVPHVVATSLLCFHLLSPLNAWAQEAAKSPLSYSIREYGMVLMTALLGGLVSWYTRVRKGELKGFSLFVLVGELSTSALAGLLAFWLCEYAALQPLLTAAIVGIAGHAGARALTQLENWAERKMHKDPA